MLNCLHWEGTCGIFLASSDSKIPSVGYGDFGFVDDSCVWSNSCFDCFFLDDLEKRLIRYAMLPQILLGVRCGGFCNI